MHKESRYKKRILLTIFAVLGFALAVPNIAYGYIDPATTSYIIQLVAGLVISLSVAFGVFFRRLQMSFVTIKARISATLSSLAAKRKRHTTATSYKTTGSAESDEASIATKNTISDESKGSAASASAPSRKIGGAIDWKGWQEATKAAEKQKLKDQPFKLSNWLFADDRSFKQRLLLALILAGALSVTYLICSPLDLFIANRNLMPFTFYELLPHILLVGLVGFLVMGLVLVLARGRAFDFLASLMFGVLIMLWIQGSFMNPGTGLLTGDAINWGDYATRAVITTIICLLIIAIPFIVSRLKKQIWKSMVMFGCGIMIAMQLVSLLSVVSSARDLSMVLAEGSQEAVLTDKGLFEVSPKENIIVLLLDRTDGSLYDEIAASDPSFFQGKLDGFTRFTNYESSYNLTFPSVVNMLTGAKYDYRDPEPIPEFINQAYEQSTFFDDLHAAGYSNYVYTPRYFCYQDANVFSDSVTNVASDLHNINPVAAIVKMYKLTGFVYMPQLAKPRFWIATSEFDSTVSFGNYEDGSNPYVVNDFEYYNDLKSVGLTLGEDEKRFSFIHLDGAHAPYYWGEGMQRVPEDQGSEILQARGGYTIAFEYLEQLKELGLYESSTIIITADHGGKYGPPDLPNSTELFVKPAGSSSAGMVESNVLVTFENFRATVIKAAGGNMQNYGVTYFEVPEDYQAVRELSYRYTDYTGHEGSWCYVYEVRGQIKDPASWELLDEYHVNENTKTAGGMWW